MFLTGISRFSKLSVFSDLNNLNDITFDNEYADICGITEEELYECFHEGIHSLADELEVSYEEACRELKLNYDGYRFAKKGSDPTALLYQAGYLTIKDFDRKTNTVGLKVPNEEVKRGLFNDLLPLYVKPRRSTVKTMLDGIVKGHSDEMLKSLWAFFAGIPYDLKMDSENSFHNAFYILVTLLGMEVTAESHTSDGRIDLLIETEEYVYVIELKYDSSAEEALRQIEEKEYALRYESDGRKAFKIGVNFSSEKRRIEDWKIE